MYLDESGVRFGYDVFLDKKVPIASGLGGASADSVAVMLGLNKLNPEALPHRELKKMQDKLGSDTSFFLEGGLARCQGRGEQVERLEIATPYSVYLIFPGVEVQTKNIFENHKVLEDNNRCSVEELIYLLKTDIKNFTKKLFNDLEETVFRLYPSLKEIKHSLEKLPFLLKTLLSGSGSTFFALVPAGSPDYSETITKAVSCRTVFIQNPHLKSC
jgi:4-diphosphocytidyl-2-C-methyl-D-erythritol kinase